VLVGMNWHIASASVLAISVFCGLITEPSCATISSMTAVWVSESRPLYSSHVIVREFDGGGTLDEVRGDEVLGEEVLGEDVRGDDVDGVELRAVLAPGWVVIATVPGVLRSQAVMPAASTSAAPAIKTRVLIWATIGAHAF
jgi:hypothetical protein